MCELDRDDLIRRRDHFTALGSKDRAAYDMALRTHDAEKRAQAAESMLEVEREEARHALQRAEAENARLRQLVGDTSEFLHDMPSDGDAELDGLQRRCREALATPPPESELCAAPKRHKGRVMTNSQNDLDGALDCLYTKAMHGRDLNGPDGYAISQAYDLVRRHLTASGVPSVRVWCPECRYEAAVTAETTDHGWRCPKCDSYLHTSGVPSVCPDCRDGSGSEVTGWYYQCDQCGRHWKEVEQDSGVPLPRTERQDLHEQLDKMFPECKDFRNAVRHLIDSDVPEGVAELQDIACAISEAAFGGELAWSRMGKDAFITEIRRRLRTNSGVPYVPDTTVDEAVKAYTDFIGRKPDWSAMMIALNTVRGYLTTSGLPYIPDEVRRIEEWARWSEKYATDPVAVHIHSSYRKQLEAALKGEIDG